MKFQFQKEPTQLIKTDNQNNVPIKYEIKSDHVDQMTPITIPKHNLHLSNIFNLQSPGNELKMLMSFSETLSKFSVISSQVSYNPVKYKELVNYQSIKKQFQYLQKCFSNDPSDQNVAAALLNFYILDSRLDVVDFKLFIASLFKSIGSNISSDLGLKIVLSYAVIINDLKQCIDTFEYICQIIKKGKTSFIIEVAEKVFQNLFNVTVLNQHHFQLTPQSPPKLLQLHLNQYKHMPPDKQLLIIKEIKRSLLPNFDYKNAKQNEKDLYVVYQLKKLALLLEMRQHTTLNQKADKLILLLINQQHKILYIKARNQIMQQLINNDYEFHQEVFDTIMAGYRCAPVKQSRIHLIHARRYLRLTHNNELLSDFMAELDTKFEKKIQQQVIHASSSFITDLEYFRKIAGNQLKNGDYFVDLARYLILYQNMLPPAIQSLQIALNFTPQNGDIYFWWLLIKQISYCIGQNNIMSHEDDIFKRTFLRVQPEYGNYFIFIKNGLVKSECLPIIYLIMEKIVDSEILAQKQLIQRLFTSEKPNMTVEDILQTGNDLTLSNTDSSLTSTVIQQISEVASPRLVLKIEEQVGQESNYDILGSELYYDL